MSSSDLLIARGKKPGKLLMFRDPYIVVVLSCLLIVFHIRIHKQQQYRITKQYNTVSSYNPSIDGIVIRQVDAIVHVVILNKPRSLISLIHVAAPLIRFLVLYIHTSLSPIHLGKLCMSLSFAICLPFIFSWTALPCLPNV
jgi:hypothetical protein